MRFNDNIKEEMVEIKKNVNKLQSESFAYEMLKDQRKQNKRIFTILIIVLCMWFATIGYLIYVLNDIGTIETTTSQEVSDIENVGGDIINGGSYGENKTNN